MAENKVEKKREIEELEKAMADLENDIIKFTRQGRRDDARQAMDKQDELEAAIAALSYPLGIQSLENIKAEFNKLDLENFVRPWIKGRKKAPGEIITRVSGDDKFRLIVRIGKA